ncbi:hypothetical protein TNCV_4851801 [Trichonephila clavipes]|nr:hypothetical protein TNCV_4851801 [Trichonephila clavipes]
MDLVIFNHGQVNKGYLGSSASFPNFYITPTTEHLSIDRFNVHQPPARGGSSPGALTKKNYFFSTLADKAFAVLYNVTQSRNCQTLWSTPQEHLQQIGKVSRAGIWVLHNLPEEKKLTDPPHATYGFSVIFQKYF